MCGFVGYRITQLCEDESAIIKRMADTIVHRGPDQEGYHLDDRIALGFRRLSIIDLESGSQPIYNEDRTLVLVFNGEIYNYQLLREELQKKGHTFKTGSDSEVLVHGYEEYGKSLTEKLIGMFAFVIWDSKKNEIFGARDIFGIKPFYYYKDSSAFLFGSEIKSFLPHPQFKKELNAKHLPTYLSFEYIPTNETFFKNVFKLPGGHCFTYKDGELSIQQYYTVRFDIDESKTLEEWAKLIDERITDSVERHRISDVEVGCFLSSGVDSSIVAKKVSERFEKINGKELPVKTFSIGYDHTDLSELEDARIFAQAVGLPNTAIVMNDEMFFSHNDRIQYYMDEPLPNPSEIPLFFLTQKAAESVKVVLSGEGADELFGGYPLYLAEAQMMKYERLPEFLRKTLGFIASMLPNFKGKHFLIAGASKPWKRYLRNNYVFNKQERNKVLSRKIDCPFPEEISKEVFDKVVNVDPISQTQYADIHIWMAYDILQKADKMSMANSLELRVPFLDRLVLETAMKIPSRFRTDGVHSKMALRKAAENYLPEQTVKMKKKGFPVPLERLLREEKYYGLVKEKFQGDVAKMFFNVKYINRLLEDHRNGAHNMKKVWTIYTFIIWYEEFFVKR